jgi:hypothetical protein
MPIALGLRAVFHEGARPQDAVLALLQREPAREVREREVHGG